MDAYKWNYGHPQIIMDIHIYRVYSLFFCFVLFSCFGNTLHINISYMYWNLFIVHITGAVVGGIFLQFDIYPGNNYCDNVSLLFAVKLA